MTITLGTARAFFDAAAEVMESHRDELCELDAQAGDGDIGLTMSKGFVAVRDRLAGPDGEGVDLAGVFRLAAMTMMNAAPSTMGTLVASGLLRAAGKPGSETAEDDITVDALLEALIAGIQSRGKAQRGEKTILDPLYAARDCVSRGHVTPAEMEARAHEEARRTAEMPAVHGRAARYPDASVGKQDAGATVGAYLISALARALTAA